MSYSKNGPFVRCLACDMPLTDAHTLPLKAKEGDPQDYHGCYEDVCNSCKIATQRAYDYDYNQWDGLWNAKEEFGPAYGEIDQ